ASTFHGLRFTGPSSDPRLVSEPADLQRADLNDARESITRVNFSSLQRLLNLFRADHSFTQNLPLIAMQLNNRRRCRQFRFAAVQNQLQPVPQLTKHLLGVRTRL